MTIIARPDSAAGAGEGGGDGDGESAGEHADAGRPEPADLRSNVAELLQTRATAREGPSAAATERQHARGKLTVHERLDLLFDPGTFREIEQLRRHRASGFGLEDKRPATDGVVTGWGKVRGRTLFVFARDFRIFGGSLGEAHAQKIHKVMDLAEAAGAPLVALNDGAGARIQEGVTALAGYGGIFRRTVRGASVHGSVSGAATIVCADERECLEDVRHLLSLLPSNNRELPPVEPSGDPPDRRCEALLDLVPPDAGQSYDMRAVITEFVDDGDFFEIHSRWAPNIICAFARLDGQVVGIVGNQPAALAGVLDVQASEKAARFVQFCDAFNIPLVTLVDVPGFLPGKDQEYDGIIRHGAKLLYAYCNATVPRIQVILRKAYGGAYIVMDSRSVGTDLSFAWPTNEIAVMGAEGAANVVFRREIAAAPDPDEARRQRIKEYRQELMHPCYAAERGLVDDVIDPADTRTVLIDALAMLSAKDAPLPSRKHGNQPM